MFTLVKSIVKQIMLISHHLGSGLTGAFAFGFVAYLLDIGGFRTAALVRGSLDTSAVLALGGVLSAFIGFNMLMRRLMGKHGVF